MSSEYICLHKVSLPVVLNGASGFMRNIVDVISSP